MGSSSVYCIHCTNSMYQNLVTGRHVIKIKYVYISWNIKLLCYQFTWVVMCCNVFLYFIYFILSSKFFKIIFFYYKPIVYFLIIHQISFQCSISFLSITQSRNVQNDKEKQFLHIANTKWMQRQEDLILSILEIHQFHCFYLFVCCLLVLAFRAMSVTMKTCH